MNQQVSQPQTQFKLPEKVGIPPPPDYIFKYQRNRIAPAQEVWGEGTNSYIPIRAEYIEGKGNFVHYFNVPFPSKTVAPVEAIYSLNGLKRAFLSDLQLLSLPELRLPLFSILFIGKKRRQRLLTSLCMRFISMANLTVKPFYLKDGYYGGLAKEIRAFIGTLLVSLGIHGIISEDGKDRLIADKMGEIIGMFFEFDNAYRFRLTDLFNETSKEKLMDLPNELNRLLAIEESREVIHEGLQNTVSVKFQTIGKMVNYLWKLPSVRKALKKAIQAMNFDNFKLDEGDIYHTCLYADYNVQGKTIEERIKILQGYHGDDPTDFTKWPPRITIRQSPQLPNDIKEMAEKVVKFREEKNFTEADKLIEELHKKGFDIKKE